MFDVRIRASISCGILSISLAVFGEGPNVRVGMYVPKDPTLHAIKSVPEDDYLRSIVQSEMPAGWPLEALKAQTVVSRTFLRKNRGRHKKEGYDFCNLAHCQVYRENSVITPRVDEAVRSTKGEVLLYQGKPIEALFHSCCGGSTAASDTLWPGSPLPYLGVHADAGGGREYCRASPDFHWTAHLSRVDLERLFQESFPEEQSKGALKGLEVLARDEAGRAKTLRVQWSAGEQLLNAYAFYRLWGHGEGWHHLKSTWFDVRSSGDGFDFQGRGLGHGVGFCQWGARGRAEAGMDYRQILSHYFPGTVGTQAKQSLSARAASE